MHDGMPYGPIQGQGQGHEPIQGSRIENLHSREVDRQSPTGLIFVIALSICGTTCQATLQTSPVFRGLENHF